MSEKLIPDFVGFSQALGPEQPLVDAMQPLLLRFGQQGIVLDVKQMVDDEPYRLVGGHPILVVETFQVYGQRITSQGAFTPKVKVSVEITQRQFAQRAVDRLAPAASGVVRFGNCAPAAILTVDGDDMVGVALSLEIE